MIPPNSYSSRFPGFRFFDLGISLLPSLLYDNGTAVTFLTANDYCNSHMEQMITFRFRAIALDASNSIVATSDYVTQQVEVVCLVDHFEVKFAERSA